MRRRNMDFYHISDQYIDFLRQYDKIVPDNKHESRPYLGIVVQINDIKYYAPFTSPKPKHLKMKNGKDFRKISGGKLGAINLNNMIPVPDVALIPFVINDEQDVKYRSLLQQQYFAVQEDFVNIINIATKLHELIFTDDKNLRQHDVLIKQRCCNLPLLESIYLNFVVTKK